MIGSIETVLAALEEAAVRYLVVGGVAVVLHGHLCTTAGLDLVVQLEQENLARALDALDRLGFRPRVPVRLLDFADPAQRRSWVTDRNMLVFSLWHPERRGFELDLFVDEPFQFDDAYRRSVVVELDRTRCRLISLPDLMAMKRAAGRPRDLEDLRALAAIADEDGQ